MTIPKIVLGFQQFTSIVIRRYHRKLRYASVNLSMTVRAYQHALFDFLFYPDPRSRHSLHGNAEILLCWIRMMELERTTAPIVSANVALAASEGDRHVADFLSAFCNCLLEILGTAGIGSLVRHSTER